jgi:hypothetical protein
VALDKVEKLEFVMVENAENPACRVKKLALMTVLNDDIVLSKFVFSVDRFDPVTVEKLDSPMLVYEIAVLKVEIVERSWFDKVEMFDKPAVVTFPIDVLSVEKVDKILKFREEIFDPATVEKLEMPIIVTPIEVLSVEKVERIPVFKLDRLEPVAVEKVRKLLCVVAERLEIDVEIAYCVLEKLNAVAVDKRNQEVEIPLAIRNPTELIPAVSVQTLVEILEPTFVLRVKKL